MNTPSALAEILQSHRLPEYASIIEQRLKAERDRRNAFYEEMTDESKMEFIDGEAVLHSPARNWHLNASLLLSNLMHTWVCLHSKGLVRVEKALCIFDRNDYEPDIVYFGPAKAALIRRDTLKFPVPDFIVEILSESTEGRDRGVKFDDYATHGVQEYWIVDPEEETIEQYLLSSDGTYSLKLKSASGDIASTVIRGFVIPIRAVFDADANIAALTLLMSE